MTMPLCTKRGPYRNVLLRSVWKNLTGLHRALISTPSNIIGMNWNADCEPGLNRPTSVPDLTNALVAEWKQVLRAMFQHLVESLPRRVEAVIAAMFLHLVERLPRRVEAVIAAMFQHLVESLPRRVEAVIAAIFQQVVESLPRRVEALIA